MPKKTYKRKRSSMSKRSRGMKRYKKTTRSRSRSRGGVNVNLYDKNININKTYDMDDKKPYYNSNYNTLEKQIPNNDKFQGYYKKNDDYGINKYDLTNNYIKPKNM